MRHSTRGVTRLGPDRPVALAAGREVPVPSGARYITTLQAAARPSVGGIVRDRDGAPLRVQRATRADVPDIVALLRADTIGRTREAQDYAP